MSADMASAKRCCRPPNAAAVRCHGYPRRVRNCMQPMHIEIWSDVVCPWCYVGKRRFEAALAEFPHRESVEVHWRSFELDPRAPRRRDGDRIDHLAAKYRIPRDQAEAMDQQITEAGRSAGLDLRLDRTRG